MAARKRKRAAPKSRRRVVRRRNPRPSTKGGRRVSARRAYMKTPAPRRRRVARKNPRSIFQNPAFQYGASAVAGAAIASVLNGYGDVAKAKAIAEAAAVGPAEKPKLGVWAVLSPKIGEYEVHPGIVGGAISLTLASTKMIKSPKTRAMLIAAGVGMLAPAAIDAATQAFMPKNNPRGLSAYRMRQARRLQASPSSVSNYSSAAHFAQDLVPS
jgi:hypothetical protein